jgi:hypothetical protein
MKESTLWHQLQWIKAHQDDKCPYEDLNIWCCMNCDADRIAEKFREWIDNREVKPIEEGFPIKQMAVSITVDCKWITSHVLHKIHLHIQGSKHQTYLQDLQLRW